MTDQASIVNSWKMYFFARFRWLMVKLGLSVRFATVGASLMNDPRNKANAFANYSPTKHDVFVCVSGKSGTNWMLQMVTQVADHGRAEFAHIHDVCPWPDAPMPGIVSLKTPTHEQASVGLRAIKTHLEAEFVPYSPDAKYIVVVRDPKDAAVSGYYFNESMFPGMNTLSMEEWVDIFVNGRSIYGSWSTQVASFWAWRNRENVMVLFYEEMKQHPLQTVQLVAEFLGVRLSSEALAMVMEKSDFAYMKTINHKFAPPIPSVGHVASPILIRSGKKGGYKQELSEAMQEKIDRLTQAQLQAAESDFPYERYMDSTT